MNAGKERFGGIARLYGNHAPDRLAAAHVAVIGVGGVGSWTVEALVRSGIGEITMIDMDDVCITNTNRQLPALEGEIGRPKVSVIAERARRINPDVQIHAVQEFLLESNAERLLEPRYDWVVDAVDRMSIKALIIAKAVEREMKVLTIGGAGGRRDLTQIRVGDLGRTGGDNLLKQVRKKLRRTHGWAKGEGNDYGVAAIYSAEPQVYPQADGTVCPVRDLPEEGEDANLRMDCASGYGAATFVTGAFGFAAAGEIVRQMTA